MSKSRFLLLAGLFVLVPSTAHAEKLGSKTLQVLIEACRKADISDWPRKQQIAFKKNCEIAIEHASKEASRGTVAVSGPSVIQHRTGSGSASTAAPTPTECPIFKRLFVRSDPLDNFHYNLECQDEKSLTAADAKGASVSYTNNQLASTQTAAINGRASYLLFARIGTATPEDLPTFWTNAYALAPFISANGTWDEPIKKTNHSALRGGADLAFSVSSVTFPINLQYFYISPFHQTDFRGVARVDGANFAWEPLVPELRLGVGLVNPYFGFFWQFRAEAEVVEVSAPGFTNLVKGDHEWLGETVRANLQLFPITLQHDWPPWLGGRFSVIGTAQNYYDARTSAKANYYSVALQYKLGPCKKPEKPKPDEPDICSIQGSSSISFEYDWGADKDTLVKVNQYLVKLGYAF